MSRELHQIIEAEVTMRKSTNTVARQLLVFYEDPINQPLIAEADRSVYGKYYPRLWHFIFLHLFYCGPKDPESKPVVTGQPKGSNDPKWDLLFGNFQAIRARSLMLRYIRYRDFIVAKQIKEKAA